MRLDFEIWKVGIGSENPRLQIQFSNHKLWSKITVVSNLELLQDMDMMGMQPKASPAGQTPMNSNNAPGGMHPSISNNSSMMDTSSSGVPPQQQQQGGNQMGEQNSMPLSQMLASAVNNMGGLSTTKSINTTVTPSWRLELMMEKLRQKRNQLKPLQETAKNLRQALMERRCILDPSDKLHLQKCLDTLQQSIKVNSLSSMVERLDMVSRQLGLQFTPGETGQEWFISSDMFYLEVLIDSNGVVRDIKIQHEGKTEQLASSIKSFLFITARSVLVEYQCPDLIKSLEVQDFKDFTAHLQGLISIYNLNADKIIKSKAFIALQALEADLAAMASTYSNQETGERLIMKSLLGHFQPRRGGHPVKLTYYISPYEFFDKDTKTCVPNDIAEIVKRQIGTSATVSIQGSPGINRKLQMSATVNIMRTPDGKNLPRYGTLNATNSTALPACFVINLGKPIPIFKELLTAIQTTTGIENVVTGESQPILNLVTQVVSGNQLDCSEEKGLFVTLPDQHHCYFMTETAGMEGVLISSISFTLASQLPQVIVTLRQQLTFNTLVGSCVRLCSKPVESGSIVFEVSALSHHNLSVSFQHPLDDSLVTLEFDLRDVSHPQCRVHALYSTTPDMIPTLEEHACRVIQRSMSIPVTVRAVIRRWQSMKLKTDIPKPDSLIPAPSNSSSSTNPLLPVGAPSCGLESQQTQQPTFKQCMNYNAPAQTAPIDFISYMSNPIFASLSQNFQSQSQSKNGQGQMTPHSLAASSSVLQGLLDQNNPAKRRKRNKTSTEIQKSPVRQKSPIRQEEPGAAGTAWMTELGLGLEQDGRWNIDITPVNSAAEELKRKFPVKRSVSLDSNVESEDRLPSLSITPVNATAGGTSSTVNSLLASIRPGIEIIPLPNPPIAPTIPNSITVTPILPNSTDIKKIKKRPEDMLEKKKIKKLDIKHVNKLQQQGGKPSVSTMKSVSTLPKTKKLTKSPMDMKKSGDPNKMEKDKSLVIYQPPKTQAATQAVAAALAAAKTQAVPKKSSLDSIINKLKSAAPADIGDSPGKKSEQMSTKDLLKASSSITDIIQKTASKVNEYSVKSSSGLVPGGGLKLTINKSLTAPKFGMELNMKKKTVLKRPLGQKPKSLTPLKDDLKRPLLKKEEMSKITDTRKLYMPSLEGALFKDNPPKFDLKNFQIPKKSKPIEKVETPPPAQSEKNSDLVVESIITTPSTPPQITPPRQPTPQPMVSATPTPTTSSSNPNPLPALTPIGPPPPPIITPSSVPVEPTNNVPRTEEPKIESPVVDIPPPPPPQPLPMAMPQKETIISPESPEPMDTSESIATPQNIPTTPPTTADDAPAAPTEKTSEAETVIPPRSTTPAPPPRSVTPAPPRATTPSPMTATTTTTTNNSVTSAPATVEKVAVEETSTVPPPPPPPASEPSPVVSMTCITVKSPAPNSPMLALRSPLIVQSPHTPFTIDDDLMDEALIGGGPSNNDKAASS
ncbi:Mediator of RNA polymerase II transcription subunit 1 [Orchesella cincta]|uniref:Mediator of RNA polymerase II transcription subunit 1 n=1 Tax=Orchesella cincta TaxID=48709 RepID=A0A1D2M980_ORCCI|nr:Mediator of RNA polymerase II transcription subunit 1 [Orchesella cincta]